MYLMQHWNFKVLDNMKKKKSKKWQIKRNGGSTKQKPNLQTLKTIMSKQNLDHNYLQTQPCKLN